MNKELPKRTKVVISFKSLLSEAKKVGNIPMENVSF